MPSCRPRYESVLQRSVTGARPRGRTAPRRSRTASDGTPTEATGVVRVGPDGSVVRPRPRSGTSTSRFGPPVVRSLLSSERYGWPPSGGPTGASNRLVDTTRAPRRLDSVPVSVPGTTEPTRVPTFLSSVGATDPCCFSSRASGCPGPGGVSRGVGNVIDPGETSRLFRRVSSWYER